MCRVHEVSNLCITNTFNVASTLKTVITGDNFVVSEGKCLYVKATSLEATFQLSFSPIKYYVQAQGTIVTIDHPGSKFTLLQLFHPSVGVHHEVYVVTHQKSGFLLLKLALIHTSLYILQNHPRFLSIYG